VGKSAAAVLQQAIRSVEARVDQSALSDRELIDRFAEHNDQAAFAALVRRYSGMVLGVCRRALANVQDAEDACQATFLVLARKATDGKWRQSVANWLYTTARRIAANARRAAERRARREGKAAVPEVVQPVDQMTGRELLAALDEELDKLSPRYREPIVLCYLEGLSREEAAGRLGVPAGTVKIQLERGRKKLGDALTRRGCGLGAGLLALAVVTSPAGAAPPRLIQAILASVSGSPSAAVAALARGVTMNAVINKAMSIILAVVATGVFGIGMAALSPPAVSRPPAASRDQATPTGERPKDRKPAEAARETKEPTVSGRVLSPAGKPLAGAELFLVGGKKPLQKLGRTDSEGRFTVSAPRGERWVNLVARAPGVGIDFIDLGMLKDAEKVELRLVKDHAVRGRVINTEGKPVPGVTVSVTHVSGYANESLDSFLATWKKRNAHDGVPHGVKNLSEETPLSTVTTGKDGRFVVTGVGAERVLSLHLRGAGIAETEVWVVNRAGFDPKPYNEAMADSMARMRFGFGMAWLLHGPDVSVVAETEKLIRGVVKDRTTGKPRPGVTVRLTRSGRDLLPIIPSAITDSEGRYEIRGARKAKAYMVEVSSDAASGHMACQARAVDTPGYTPITIDIAVKKGVVLTGRVLDRETSKSLRGFAMASVLADNPLAKDFPEFDSSAFFHTTKTADDGTFRVVCTPGPVILMGGVDPQRMREGESVWFRYKAAVADPKYPIYFPTKEGYKGNFFTYRGGFSPIQGHFCKVLMLPASADVVKQDIVLERASAVPMKIVDETGKPVRGTWVTGLSPEGWHRPCRVENDTCSVYQLHDKPRLVVFHHPVKNRFATMRLKGTEKDTVEVKLGPGGAVKGRLLGANGKPLAGAVVSLHHRERPAEEVHAHVHRDRLVETDTNGNFQIDDVVPGTTFSFWCTRGRELFRTEGKLEWSCSPGKRLDLGEVRMKLDVTNGD
jgi:RNA polymerase sigma factor (sigma-70 family)